RLTESKMENGRTVTALQMHPLKVSQGSIKGRFPPIQLDKTKPITFKAQVGFLGRARGTDGVTFWVWEHHIQQGKKVSNPVVQIVKRYTGALQTVSADLSHLAGKKVRIELRVDAGESSRGDWAAWVNPQITFGKQRTIRRPRSRVYNPRRN
ncbi:MAG: hypothetical protein D3910_26780, partial [Candidatus Electrothrix sp. ATG2]|nr:hypothetical protein [Candidatus Electrothrix sp. ATG2]